MTGFCFRSTILYSAACLLMAGCATDGKNISPSLLSQLKVNRAAAKGSGVQQASYQAEAGTGLASKKVEDPLTLRLRYARWMEELENFPDAQLQYSQVLAERPKNFEAIIGLARIEQAVGDVEKAEAGFRRAYALRPESSAAQHALGQFQLSQGRVAEALPLLNKAVLAQPDDKAYRYDLAVALAKSGDINAALPHFQRTVGEAAAHHNIATILRDAGNFRGAEQHFRQALSIQPDLAESRHALASLYSQIKSQQLAESARGTVEQGTPNQSVRPAAHQSAAPRTATRNTATRTSPQTLTPTQREQRRNQQTLTR